jgi:hypothetical protein
MCVPFGFSEVAVASGDEKFAGGFLGAQAALVFVYAPVWLVLGGGGVRVHV